MSFDSLQLLQCRQMEKRADFETLKRFGGFLLFFQTELLRCCHSSCCLSKSCIGPMSIRWLSIKVAFYCIFKKILVFTIQGFHPFILNLSRLPVYHRSKSYLNQSLYKHDKFAALIFKISKLITLVTPSVRKRHCTPLRRIPSVTPGKSNILTGAIFQQRVYYHNDFKEPAIKK